METNKIYQAPTIERAIVELEGGFCGSIDENGKNPKSDLNELSSREKDILAAVAMGKTNKEIADEFNISIYTVISHRRNISQKLGINSIPGLTVYAIMNKLVDISDFS